jgi:hypothetical protein
MLQEQRVLATIPYDSGNTVEKDIPRVYVSKKWQLRGKVTVRSNVANAEAYGSKIANAPCTIIKRVDVRVVGDKSQVIKSFSGEELLLSNLFDNGGLQENVNNCATGTNSGSSEVNVDRISYFSLDLNWNLPDANQLAIQSVDVKGKPLSVPRAYNPQNMTLFNPTNYNPVEIYVTWGNIDDIMTGYTATKLTVSSVDLKLVSIDLPELGGIYSINREMRKIASWTSASTDFRIDLPKGNLMRRVVIIAKDNGTLSNSVINNVQVVVDESIRRVDAGFNQLRNENSKKYAVPFAQLPDGTCIVEFDSDRDFTGLLDVTKVDNVRLSLDVNGSTLGTVEVITQEITR